MPYLSLQTLQCGKSTQTTTERGWKYIYYTCFCSVHDTIDKLWTVDYWPYPSWLWLNLSLLKTFSAVFLFSIDFFYIYIRCRIFNAEFNKLIKTMGHCSFFRKMMLNTPTFAKNFDFILTFSHCSTVVTKH